MLMIKVKVSRTVMRKLYQFSAGITMLGTFPNAFLGEKYVRDPHGTGVMM